MFDHVEVVKGPRFRTEVIDGAEWTILRTKMNWFALPFLSVWLILWTFGGGAALYTLLNGEGSLFLAVWLIGWAFG